MVGSAGSQETGRDQFSELLTTRERVLGPEQRSTAATRTELAHWTAAAQS